MSSSQTLGHLQLSIGRPKAVVTTLIINLTFSDANNMIPIPDASDSFPELRLFYDGLFLPDTHKKHSHPTCFNRSGSPQHSSSPLFVKKTLLVRDLVPAASSPYHYVLSIYFVSACRRSLLLVCFCLCDTCRASETPKFSKVFGTGCTPYSHANRNDSMGTMVGTIG